MEWYAGRHERFHIGESLMKEELWAAPLLLLPGVALLIMSTSARFAQIHSEIHRIMDHSEDSESSVCHLLYRSKLFRDALVSLYISVALFAVASLVGGLSVHFPDNGPTLVAGLTFGGVLFLLFASTQLVRESLLSLKIIQEHVQENLSGTSLAGSKQALEKVNKESP